MDLLAIALLWLGVALLTERMLTWWKNRGPPNGRWRDR